MKTSTLLLIGGAVIVAVLLTRQQTPAKAAAVQPPKKKKSSIFSKIGGIVKGVTKFVPGLPKFDYAPVPLLSASYSYRAGKPKGGGAVLG